MEAENAVCVARVAFVDVDPAIRMFAPRTLLPPASARSLNAKGYGGGWRAKQLPALPFRTDDFPVHTQDTP